MTTIPATAPLPPRRIARPAVPRRRPAVQVRPIIRVLFVLFVASMPLETAKIEGMGASVTFSKLFGYLFFLAAMTQPRVVFRRPRAAVVWFWLYATAIAVLIFVDPAAGAYAFLAQTVQWMVLLWAGSNLFAFRSVRSAALLAFSAGTIALAAAQAFAPVISADLADRATALGENHNTAGALFALGIVAALGWRREYSHGRPFMRWMLMGGVALMGIQLVRTSSRGAMLALVCGLLVYVAVAERFAAKVKMAVVSALVLGIVGYFIVNSESARRRWIGALQQRDLAARELIFPVAWQMFTEQPLLGWGPQHHLVELGRRFGVEALEEHNLVLYIIAQGGVAAGIPYFVGILAAVALGFRARRAGVGITALALLVCLGVVNMSNVFHYRKVHWVILAFAIGAAPGAVRRSSALAASRRQQGGRDARASAGHAARSGIGVEAPTPPPGPAV